MQPLAHACRQRRWRESPGDAEARVNDLAVAALGTAAAFVLLWWRQTRTCDATSVDAAWAGAIGLLGVAFAATGVGSLAQRLLAIAIAVPWSARLCWHLLRHRVFARGSSGHGSSGHGRSAHGGEDGRYRAMREHWGERAHQHLFWFYLVQAAAALLFALPFWFLSGSQLAAVTAAQWVGVALFALAQMLEGLSDRQLEHHRRDPSQKGRTCRAGLWRYSRHPNYFFEWLSWCGIAVVAAPAAGWLCCIQPIAMFLLVRFVSGVPFTELQSIKSRGDDYRRYQQSTNAFFPWFPREAEER
jgi:steroid 5-alpha reductase family enzyme